MYALAVGKGVWHNKHGKFYRKGCWGGLDNARDCAYTQAGKDKDKSAFFGVSEKKPPYRGRRFLDSTQFNGQGFYFSCPLNWVLSTVRAPFSILRMLFAENQNSAHEIHRPGSEK